MDAPNGAKRRPVDRRTFLRLVASASAAAFLAACALETRPSGPVPSGSRPRASAPPESSSVLGPIREPSTPASATGGESAPVVPGASGVPTPSPESSGNVGPTGRRTLYRDASLATGRSARLEPHVSVLVANGRIAWIRPTDAEEDPGPKSGLTTVDARGATIVPGFVDAHSHVVLPGGLDYVDHVADPPDVLTAVAERNGDLAWRAGVRWLRDVGSPVGDDPVDARHRALALGIRDRWIRRPDRPGMKAAGTWIAAPGGRPAGSGLEVHDPASLPAAALGQLRDGADFVKLYVQAAGGGSPWTASEIGRAVKAVHDAGARVTAHVRDLGGAQAAVGGGVDSIEHGFQIDRDLARTMAGQGTYLITTISVPKTWLSFASDAPTSSFGSAAGRAYSNQLLEDALSSARTAHDAGVRIAAGTDFGGGGPRAGVLAGEVESLVEAGLQPWEALAAATWRGGELLGVPDAGVVQEGGPADFILVEGDPLSDPAALWRIWRPV